MSIPAPSRHGVEFIAQHEGFRSHPYNDGTGVWTIGYGETNGIGPNTPPWTQEQAFEDLQKRVYHTYFPPIKQACEAAGLSLNQHQVDALTSLVYNVGPGILGPTHTMGQEIRAKNIRGMADAFLLYDMAGGKPILKPRREQERALFLS
jgi:lysozyme